MAGCQVVDRCLDVPVDWDDPAGETLPLFVRELASIRQAKRELPLLVYLQGGPGGKSPRPTGGGWLPEALKRFRVLLVDQRGTGRSGRLEGSKFLALTATEGARRLASYRADSIVRDLEALRLREYGGARWYTLGQSFGGFITMSYLSMAPEGLAGCMVAGGLPALLPDAAEVYRRTFPRVKAKTESFWKQFPSDQERMGLLADQLVAEPPLLPDGDVLTVRRFQSLGIDLGMGPGAARLHWLLDEAWLGATGGPLSETFLAQVCQLSGYRDNPLFMVLQESIYGSGPPWAAQAELDRRPEFAEAARPLLFTGEMMFPWMLEEIAALRPFEGAAQLLAHKDDWPELYDIERLRSNEIPVAAVVYHDDMYVDAGLSLATAGSVGALNAWVTNEYEHDGLHSGAVLPKLMQLLEEGNR